MNRRELLVLAGGAMAPLALHAEQKTEPVIGLLNATSSAALAPYLEAFRLGLLETGYVEGKNVKFEYRYAEFRNERLPALAADLVGRHVDLILTSGGTSAARAAKDATQTIPVVFAAVGDAVGAGLVGSLARPGGNLTGFSVITGELMPKRFELMFELVPQAAVIALLVNPKSPNTERMEQDTREAARRKGVQLAVLEASSADDFERVFAGLSQTGAGGLVVAADPLFNARREDLVALAERQKIPATYEWREFVAAGGLISYGPSLADTYRQAGVYAGRILKGEKPADLPVQQPTTFELVVNLKTAKALGLTIPPSILARADEVIE